jgi:thioredoxin 1
MAADSIVTLTEDNFDAEVLSSENPVLVDFWAEWCGPCKMLAPALDELSGEIDGKGKIGKVDIDAQQGLAAKFGIRSIPTLLVFKGGEVVKQLVGVQSKTDMKASLEAAM